MAGSADRGQGGGILTCPRLVYQCVPSPES